jgi:hypothetical protein
LWMRHLKTVHLFHRFAFLHMCKRFPAIVSWDAALFRQSHSNPVLNFR